MGVISTAHTRNTIHHILIPKEAAGTAETHYFAQCLLHTIRILWLFHILEHKIKVKLEHSELGILVDKQASLYW